jgi:hypothetical protein
MASIPTQPQLIHVGRGDVYIGCDIPLDPPVPMNNGIPTTGRFVGATMADAVWTYKPKSFDIKTQQSTGIVGYVVTDEELDLEFTFGQIEYRNLLDLMATPLDQQTFVSVGGRIFPTTQSCLIVAPRRAGGFIQAFMYAAFFAMDRAFTFSREKDSPIKVTARALAIGTRLLGDQLGYIHPHIPEST